MTSDPHEPPTTEAAVEIPATHRRGVGQVSRPDATGASGRWVVAGLAVLVAAFVAYLALGMPGMDHSGGGMRDKGHPSARSDGGDEP